MRHVRSLNCRPTRDSVYRRHPGLNNRNHSKFGQNACKAVDQDGDPPPALRSPINRSKGAIVNPRFACSGGSVRIKAAPQRTTATGLKKRQRSAVPTEPLQTKNNVVLSVVETTQPMRRFPLNVPRTSEAPAIPHKEQRSAEHVCLHEVGMHNKGTTEKVRNIPAILSWYLPVEKHPPKNQNKDATSYLRLDYMGRKIKRNLQVV